MSLSSTETREIRDRFVKVNVRFRDNEDFSDSVASIVGTTCVRYDGVTHEFDGIFASDVTQNSLDQSIVVPIFKDFVSGGLRSAAFVSYGQTGSGKTFTMYGTVDCEGIVPRFLRYILRERRVRINAVEIYREKFQDLLATTGDKTPALCKRGANDDVRVDVHGDLMGARTIEISCFEDAKRLVDSVQNKRKVGCTSMNDKSSRSHTILRIIDYIGGKSCDFIDLAGSERLSRTNAIGTLKSEGISINSSLSSFAAVIAALASGKSVPTYRNSLLTRALRTTFEGRTRVCVLLCCSGRRCDRVETRETLRFGTRLRNVKPSVAPIKVDQGTVDVNRRNGESSPYDVQRIVQLYRDQLRENAVLIRELASNVNNQRRRIAALTYRLEEFDIESDVDSDDSIVEESENDVHGNSD